MYVLYQECRNIGKAEQKTDYLWYLNGDDADGGKVLIERKQRIE
jgi:hypothetical protein